MKRYWYSTEECWDLLQSFATLCYNNIFSEFSVASVHFHQSWTCAITGGPSSQINAPCTYISSQVLQLSKYMDFYGKNSFIFEPKKNQWVHVICCLGGQYSEKLWMRSWKCYPGSVASGSIFKAWGHSFSLHEAGK